MTNEHAIELLDYLQRCIWHGWAGDIIGHEEECDDGDDFYTALDVAIYALKER